MRALKNAAQRENPAARRNADGGLSFTSRKNDLSAQIIFRESLKQLQHVHKHRKAQKEHEADRMDDRFRFAVDRLAAHPLDRGKDDFRAVERGNRQQVENRKVDADIGGNFQKLLQTARSDLRSQFYGADRPAERGQPQIARKQLPQDFEDRAADAERIGKRPSDRLEKSEPFIGRGINAVGKTLPVLRILPLYAERVPERCRFPHAIRRM